MPIFSKNPPWRFWGLRALACLSSDDAEAAKCLDTINRMEPCASVDRWYREWIGIAETHFAAARLASAVKQYSIARASYLHASMYYRVSYLPFFGLPVDPWLVDSFLREAEAFDCAAELSEFPLAPVKIAVEGFSLRAYWGRPNRIARRRGTIICVNDYGSNLHETFSAHGFAAIHRGYNCLVIDGPGQGNELIRSGSTIRPDWETVIGAAIDFLLLQPEVDPSKIILAGWGLGAGLALRAGAFESRISALITGPGVSTLILGESATTPSAIVPGFLEAAKNCQSEIEDKLRSPCVDPIMHWQVMKCIAWVHGRRSFKDLIQDLPRFEVRPHITQITIPTLLSAHVDSPLLTAFEELGKSLRGPTTIMGLPRARDEGSKFPWEFSNRHIFDWLDQILPDVSTIRSDSGLAEKLY